jgi:hypothetical protein
VRVSDQSQRNLAAERRRRRRNGPRQKRSPVILQGGQLSPDTDAFTVVILGVPRGGTTMVAGVAQRCGLFIGDNLLGNLEDQRFVRADAAELEATVLGCNEMRKVWGWKYPRAADYLSELLPKLRNPRLVMVWRDPVAAASRSISRGDPVALALKRMTAIQNKNLRLVQEASCPILHVSYERAIREPLPFIEALVEFIGGKLPAEMQELVAFMEPGSYKPVEGAPPRRPRAQLASL